LVPVIVTAVPGIPAAGVKLAMVGSCNEICSVFVQDCRYRSTATAGTDRSNSFLLIEF
jgi:hypothetical protein